MRRNQSLVFCGLMLEILVTHFTCCMQFNSNYEVGNYGNGGNLLLWNEVYKLLLFSEVKNEKTTRVHMLDNE